MNQINAAFTQEIARELDEIRRLAAEPRVLQDLELGWVSGGDGAPGWESPTP
jgi:hypothetical protein